MAPFCVKKPSGASGNAGTVQAEPGRAVFLCLERPHSHVLRQDTFARSNQKPELRPGASQVSYGHQEAVSFCRARCVPDRLLVVPFRRTEASTCPMAAAIASSRCVVACWQISLARGLV